MPPGMYTIAGFLTRGGLYYTGSRWESGIRKACLYTLKQINQQLDEAACQGAAIAYVVQDRTFKFFDGAGFTDDLFAAKRFTLGEAEAQIRALAHS